MIEIVFYLAAWPDEFTVEAMRIRSHLRDRALRIDHVGSTAVPGLSAKPIIDIQISVASLTPRGLFTQDMAALGYSHLDLGDFDLVYPYFRRPDEWPHTHHVHICEHGGEQERRHLAFRDYLRRHPDRAAEYLSLKRYLADVHRGSDQHSREQYALGKSAFVEGVIALAFQEGLPNLGRSDG